MLTRIVLIEKKPFFIQLKDNVASSDSRYIWYFYLSGHCFLVRHPTSKEIAIMSNERNGKYGWKGIKSNDIYIVTKDSILNNVNGSVSEGSFFYRIHCKKVFL